MRRGLASAGLLWLNQGLAMAGLLWPAWPLVRVLGRGPSRLPHGYGRAVRPLITMRQGALGRGCALQWHALGCAMRREALGRSLVGGYDRVPRGWLCAAPEVPQNIALPVVSVRHTCLPCPSSSDLLPRSERPRVDSETQNLSSNCP
jgi:hypothetical protein